MLSETTSTNCRGGKEQKKNLKVKIKYYKIYKIIFPIILLLSHIIFCAAIF